MFVRNQMTGGRTAVSAIVVHVRIIPATSKCALRPETAIRPRFASVQLVRDSRARTPTWPYSRHPSAVGCPRNPFAREEAPAVAANDALLLISNREPIFPTVRQVSSSANKKDANDLASRPIARLAIASPCPKRFSIRARRPETSDNVCGLAYKLLRRR